MKSKRHEEILKDYDTFKIKHLERLATKMLKKQEIFDKLKTKKINIDKIF